MERTFLETMCNPNLKYVTNPRTSLLFYDDIRALDILIRPEVGSESVYAYFNGGSYEFDTTIIEIPLMFDEQISIQMNDIKKGFNPGAYVCKTPLIIQNIYIDVDIELVLFLGNVRVDIPLQYNSCTLKATNPYKNHNTYKDCHHE